MGVWRWGQRKNVRNPLNGKVHQDDRPLEECEKWTRHLPELRLVDPETFDAAQQLLDENYLAFAANRNRTGQLCGSSSNSQHKYPP